MFKANYNEGQDMHVTPTTSAADAIRELMTFHHITQAEFAQHAAISQKQLSFILNRKAFMSIPVARQIEAATGMNAQWLLQLDLNYQYGEAAQNQLAEVQPFPWATE